MFVGCGNFGAPPNPPCSASKERARSVLASSSGLGVTISLPSASGSRLRSASISACDCSAQLAAALGVEVADPAQDLLEGRQSEACGLGKVRAAEEGDAVLVVEEHRQWPPPAAPGEQVLRALVDLVEVRALFAVDLDVDEEPIHELRGGRVLEGLVGHHVAPVARGVAYRQQDRLPLAGRLLQRLLSPTDTIRPGCRRAEAGRGWSRPRAGGRAVLSAFGGTSWLGGHAARLDYIGGAAGLP